MSSGVWFVILGLIYIWAGALEFEIFASEVFTFKETELVGFIMFLFGCLMMTIEKATDKIVKALKEEK